MSTHKMFSWSNKKTLYLDTILIIMKTYLYNFVPLKPHFYIVKLGFTGYTLFFLFLLKNIDCGYSLELPLCFEQIYENNTIGNTVKYHRPKH